MKKLCILISALALLLCGFAHPGRTTFTHPQIAINSVHNYPHFIMPPRILSPLPYIKPYPRFIYPPFIIEPRKQPGIWITPPLYPNPFFQPYHYAYRNPHLYFVF